MNTLQWRHNELDGGSNHQPRDCLLNCFFRRGSKKTSKLRVTGLCEGNSAVTGEFPTQRDRNVENVSIWWRHHDAYPLISIPIWVTANSGTLINRTLTNKFDIPSQHQRGISCNNMIDHYAVFHATNNSRPNAQQTNLISKRNYRYRDTVKPICNDHLYNKIYYLWFIQ